MAARKVRLTREKETYLATLYGKALDAAVEHPILGDRFAAEAVARIDYNFNELKLPSGGEITLPLRARHFDQWTRAFLAANPESTVLHLGCGLDTRVYRIDPGPKVRWFDVDFPVVIALRERLYPERDGYRRRCQPAGGRGSGIFVGPGAASPAWKLHSLCEPSQNGFSFDWPQRHSENGRFGTTYSAPVQSTSFTSSPSTRSDPFCRTLIVTLIVSSDG